jgi:hypothetical protein
MATPTTTFKIKGPIFDSSAPATLRKAVNRGLLDLATIEGSNKVKEQLYPDHGRVIGDLRNHVAANLVRDNLAQLDAGEYRYGSNLNYSNWVEGIDARNRARPGFPGWHMFQNVYERLDNNPALYEKYIGDSIIEALE